MNLKIYHDPHRKTLTIPRAALQMSELIRENKLDLLVGGGYILMKREDLSAAERMDMIRQLSDLTDTLIVRLTADSREAARRELCRGCEEDCDLSIPPCLLEQAGIDPDEALDTAVEDGRIVFTAAEEDDPLHQIDKAFLAMLGGAGVNLSGLRFLLENEVGGDE